MNARRIAKLLRELADELDDKPAEPTEPVNAPPKRKQKRQPPPAPVPARSASPMISARASKALHRLGYQVKVNGT